MVLGAAPSGAAALFVWFAARGDLAFAVPTLIIAVPVLALWLFGVSALLRNGGAGPSLPDVLACGLGALLFIGSAAVLRGMAVYE